MKILRYNRIFEQKFAFDSNKESIIKLVKRVKGGTEHPLDVNIIYGVLTGDRLYTSLFSDDIKNKWNSYFKQKSFMTDGVWSERRFNSKYKKSNDRTYNYYITISKDPNNIFAFLRNLNKLDQSIEKLSNYRSECVAYKTHTILDMMVSHNDSLKIFYYNPKLKDEIENIVKNWVISNNIKLDNREYHNGVDIRNKNGDKDSYGFILADLITTKFRDVIKKYGDKYSDESYYNWLVKNISGIIKSVKIKYE